MALARRAPDPTSSLLSSISIIYAILLLAIFIGPTVGSLIYDATLDPKFKANSEAAINGILLYSLVVAFLFLLYLLLWLSRPHFSELHHVSHASAYVRVGAIFFGAGALFFAVMNKAFDSDEAFWKSKHPGLIFAAVFLLCLQATAVVLCARMKLDAGWGVPHLGLMHLVATNLIIWIYAVVNESDHIAHVVLHGKTGHGSEEHSSEASEGDHHTAIEHHERVERDAEPSEGFNKKMEDISEKMFLPYLIEFSLIGATVFLNMWMEVGLVEEEEERRVRKTSLVRPRPVQYTKKINWNETLWGLLFGCGFLLVNIVFVVVWNLLHVDEEGSTRKILGGKVNIQA